MKTIKLAFIKPDGSVDYIFRKDEDVNHILYYLEYFENNFLDDVEIQNITAVDTPDKVGLILKDRGYITLVNNSTYGCENPEKVISSSIIVMMPNVLTEEQINMKNVVVEISDNFKDKSVWYDYFKDEYNITNCKMLFITEESSCGIIGQAIDCIKVNNVRKSK